MRLENKQIDLIKKLFNANFCTNESNAINETMADKSESTNAVTNKIADKNDDNIVTNHKNNNSLNEKLKEIYSTNNNNILKGKKNENDFQKKNINDNNNDNDINVNYNLVKKENCRENDDNIKNKVNYDGSNYINNINNNIDHNNDNSNTDDSDKINFKTNSLNKMKENNQNMEIFCGYAAIFNIKDHQNDIILPEALDYVNNTKMNVPILWQHDVEKPIGRVIEAYTDDIGLFIYATIDENLTYGREAKHALSSNTVNNMSIGYRLDKKFSQDGIDFLQKMQIFEISLVTLPANELTYAKIL